MLQQWFVNWLASEQILYCANAGAGIRVSMGTAIKMKNMGYKRGFPDVMICEPRGLFHGLFVELKCGKDSRATPEQIIWQKMLTERGYVSIIMPPLEYMQAVEWLRRAVSGYLKRNLGETYTC
jgi:hypothetical protein